MSLMIYENEAHRKAAGAVAKLGRYPITAENKQNDSFQQYRKQRRASGDDPSKDLFKHQF